MQRRAAIITALRTPVGRHGGALASVRPDDLAADIIKAVVERSGIDPASIEDVYFGATNQAGEDNRNVARMATLTSAEVMGANKDRGVIAPGKLADMILIDGDPTKKSGISTN